MKKVLKTTGKTLIILLCVVAAFLAGSTLYHHIKLAVEAKHIVPNGQMVEVNGHRLHVYSEGEKTEGMTLVLMSGSATVAPVYDFKSLYSLLSDEYHTVVIEKAGYGYSDICDVDRSIDTMLSETRQALSLAGESGPYILIPHSMSGIEAIYWAQQYPDEVAGIIGLDMAIPESYERLDFKRANRQISLGQVAVWLGLHRSLPGVYPLDATALSEHEIAQQKYLMHKNALNRVYVLEGQVIRDSASIVASGEAISAPPLLFVSNGENLGDDWIPCQQQFAKAAGGEVVCLDCGHYLHHTKHDTLAERIKAFLKTLEVEMEG